MVLDHVEAGGRRRQPGDPVQPIIPPRRDGSGRGWRSLRAPPGCAGTSGMSARTQRRRNPRPPTRQGAVPVTPSWRAQSAPERTVVAAVEHLCAQPAAGGDAKAVRSALSAATTHQKRPALRYVCGAGDGGNRADRRACPMRPPRREGLARRPCRGQLEAPSQRSEGTSARGRVRRDRRRRGLRGPSAQQEFRAGESVEHTSTRGVNTVPPLSPLSGVEGCHGCASPCWTLAKAAAVARRVCALPTRMAASNAGAGASRPGREKTRSSC